MRSRRPAPRSPPSSDAGPATSSSRAAAPRPTTSRSRASRSRTRAAGTSSSRRSSTRRCSSRPRTSPACTASRSTRSTVDAGGLVHPEALARVIRPDTTLVSVQLANNEIGTVQPVAELAAIAHASGALDAHGCRAGGGLAPALARRARRRRALARRPQGRRTEGHRRARSCAAGSRSSRCCTAAARSAAGARAPRTWPAPWRSPPRSGSPRPSERMPRPASARSAPSSSRRVDDRRCPAPCSRATPCDRLPGTVSFVFPGTSGEAVLLELERDGVICSSGSACAAGSDEPSHVLTAIGVPAELAQTAVRFTLGAETTRRRRRGGRGSGRPGSVGGARYREAMTDPTAIPADDDADRGRRGAGRRRGGSRRGAPRGLASRRHADRRVRARSVVRGTDAVSMRSDRSHRIGNSASRRGLTLHSTHLPGAAVRRHRLDAISVTERAVPDLTAGRAPPHPRRARADAARPSHRRRGAATARATRASSGCCSPPPSSSSSTRRSWASRSPTSSPTSASRISAGAVAHHRVHAHDGGRDPDHGLPAAAVRDPPDLHRRDEPLLHRHAASPRSRPASRSCCSPASCRRAARPS